MSIQWELLLFSLLVALGMGCFAFVAVTEWLGKLENIRLPGAITSLLALGIGGIISSLHLGHPERIFHILGNIKSGIAQEFIITAVIGAVIVLYIGLLIWKGASDGARKNVATIGLLVSVIAVFSTGRIYVLPARPAWNTFIIPILFVATAAALGLFTMYIWTVLKEKDEVIIQKVNKAAFFAQISFAIMIVSYIIYLFVAPFPDPSRSPQRLLAGDLSLLFWGAVVLIGLTIPIILTVKKMKAQTMGSNLIVPIAIGDGGSVDADQTTGSLLTVPIAGLCCTVVGSVAIRVLIYLMGSSVHQFIVG